MKALLLSSYRHLEIADVPEPAPGAEDVLVRVGACGICGSDVHGYDGASGRRIPPIIMGHEAAGTVASVGSGVNQFSLGERVTFDSTIYCGRCEYCLRAETNLCNQRKVLGVSCGDYRCAGAFAEYVVVPRRIVHRLPDTLSFSEAAILEALRAAGCAKVWVMDVDASRLKLAAELGATAVLETSGRELSSKISDL